MVNKLTIINKHKLLIYLGLLLALKGYAQDAIPLHASLQTASEAVKPMYEIDLRIAPESYKVQLPLSFNGVQDNLIQDQKHTLDSFFNKLRRARTGVVKDSIRVMHIGDSHIRGHFFTDRIEENLKPFFPNLSYKDFGINGATVKSFVRPDYLLKIKNEKPDLLILSFGTNESHNLSYNTRIHYLQLDELVGQLKLQLPTVPILLTAPPGSYERLGSRGRRRYRVNPRTERVVELLENYAQENHLAFWNLYSILGGQKHACDNWSKVGLLRPDHIHYLPEGYELQADIFTEAIIQAYNEYTSF